MKKAASLAICASLLCGCATDGSSGPDKQTLGTVLGTVGGALIGSQFGGGRGQIVGVLVGAAIGGFAGNRIGSWLDEKDRQAVAQEAGKALDSPNANQRVTWNNPDTGNSASVVAHPAVAEKRAVPIVRDRAVAPLPALELIGENWIATRNANVRLAPSTDAAVATTLKQGESFRAVGKVVGADWIVVAREKRTIGYVSSALVEAAPKSAQAASAVRQAVDLDAMEAGRAADPDAATTVTQEVQATTNCRALDMKIVSKDGKSEESTSRACKSAEGAWEIL
jgi:surface antigen